MPTDENDAPGLRLMVDNTRTYLHCLKKIGVPAADVSNSAMRDIRKRLTASVANELTKRFGKISKMSIEEFLENCEEYVSDIEDHSNFQKLINPGSDSDRYITTMTGQATRARWPRECIFCDNQEGSHSWRSCPKVTDPKERFKIFLKKKRCTACGGPDHHYSKCLSPKSCTVGTCQGKGNKHHNSLHEFFVKKQSTPAENSKQGKTPKHANKARFANTHFSQLQQEVTGMKESITALTDAITAKANDE